MPKLLLNAVSIGVGADVDVIAGVHAYDKDALDALRQKHLGDYLFRRSGENGKTVYSVALKSGLTRAMTRA